MSLEEYQDYLNNYLDNLKKEYKKERCEHFLFILENAIKNNKKNLLKIQKTYDEGMDNSLKFIPFLRDKYQGLTKWQYNDSIKFLEESINNFIKNNKPNDLKINLLDYSNFLVE